MKTKAILALIALASASILPSCTTVVDPHSSAPVTTQQATTTEVSPYTGSTTYKKTTTTTGY